MFGLTRQERQVILFLITVAVAGLGIDFLVKRYSPTKSIMGFSQNIGKINLNTADIDLLVSIPGIGEKLARSIIEYRNLHSGFNDLEELKGIKGITKYRYEKLKYNLFIE